MPKADLKVVDFPYEATLRDSPAKLRQLADAIEEGRHGEVSCVGVALIGGSFQCFGWGEGFRGDSPSPSAAALFGAAQLRVLQQIEAHGRDDA